LNSTKIQVILSVPIPSEAAKFVGHILSNINSIVLERPNPDISDYFPFRPGDVLPFVVFLGEVILFLPEEVVEAVPLVVFIGELSPFMVACLLLSLALVS
jgi:hypothetical protein